MESQEELTQGSEFTDYLDEPLLRLFMVVVFVVAMSAGVSGWLTFLVILVVIAIEAAVERLGELYGRDVRDPNARRRDLL